MKVVILAGGLGTRLEEETIVVPKPLVKIGSYPILWHIMKIYSHFGFNDFLICLGYKGYLIKEYFANYFLHNCDVTFDFSGENNQMIIHNKKVEPWKVTLIDTGLETQTGGRINRIKPFIDEDNFLLTYGDGLADINIKELVKFHFSHNKIATVTAVKPPAKFGVLVLDESEKNKVKIFTEKPKDNHSWINGGFFVLKREVFDYILNGDDTVWEWSPLENLAKNGELMSYFHDGFWKCMDTIRDKKELEKMWKLQNPPWKIWED